MSDPSEAAINAAQHAAFPYDDSGTPHPAVLRAAKAAHDPALGLDRSVCLRDVVGALREYEDEDFAGIHVVHPAKYIEGKFGGKR